MSRCAGVLGWRHSVGPGDGDLGLHTLGGHTVQGQVLVLKALWLSWQYEMQDTWTVLVVYLVVSVGRSVKTFL